jgi:hypothetical protein
VRARCFPLILACAPLWACHARESVESARARASEAVLVSEIGDLKRLIAQAEAGEVVTQNRIAIGLSEETLKALLDASLPQERVVGERVRIRIETAQPLFRGNSAVLVFQATAHSLDTDATARLELAGRLKDFSVEKGRLLSRIELVHFSVIDTSLGDMGSDVLDGIVRANLGTVSSLLPPLELPVQLEEQVKINGLREGVVTVKPGVLPLNMSLAHVLPVNRRLWILLDVKAGPWQRQDEPETGE